MRKNRLSNDQLRDLGENIQIGDTFLKPQVNPLTNKSIIDFLTKGESDTKVLGRTYSISSPQAYLERSQGVVQEYLKAISDKRNLSAAGREKFSSLTKDEIRESIEYLVQNENLDLSLLNRHKADDIYRLYREKVLYVKETFEELGLPNISLPSDNPYKHFLRYMVDPFSGLAPGESVHPMILELMRTSYNPSHNARNIEDITTGRSRMRSPFSIERLLKRTEKMFPDRAGDEIKGVMNHLAFEKGKKYTVITWDTETTGLTPESQIRQIALVKRTVEYTDAGEMISSAPEIISNKSFSSDLMNIAGYIDKDGNTIPLARAAYLAENGGPIDEAKMLRFEEAYKNGGAKAVEDFKEILRYFTNEGNVLNLESGLGIESIRIEGHNAESFDLDKLIGTLQRLPAFQEDPEAKSLLKKFLTLRADTNNPFYSIDTLDSSKLLMLTQQTKLNSILSDEALGLSEDLRTGLIASYSLSAEMFGAGKGTESLENLFLNTNFFELLEQKTGQKELNDLISLMQTRGTHTAEIDTILNSYISNFINNNELHIRRLPTPGMPPSGLSNAAAIEYGAKADKLEDLFKTHGFMKQERSMTAFEKFMRARIRKSSAVTPITNISDLSRMSDNVFKFLQTDEGMQKISLAVTPDYLARLESSPQQINLGIQPNHLMDMDETAAGKIYYNSELNKYVFSNFESRGIKGEDGFQVLDTDKVKAAFNFALTEAREGKKELLDLGKSGSILVNVSNEALANIGITEIEATELDQALKARSLLQNIGRKTLRTDDVGSLSEALSTTGVFYGKKDTDVFSTAIVGSKTAEYSKALIERGLPYSTYDVRSRIMATAEARATSGIGKRLMEKARFESDPFYSVLVGKDLEKLSDIGLQYTMGQGKESIFGIKRRIKNSNKTFPIDDNSYFLTPVSAKDVKKANRVIVSSDDLSKLVIREFNEDGTIKNATKFGSKEFIENANLNRFIDSTVQAFDEEIFDATINRAFAPKNLSEATMTDLAEQVLSLNIKAYKKLKTDQKFTARSIQAEMTALANQIFGENTESSLAMRNLQSLAEKETRQERESFLRSFATKESDQKVFVNNYKNVVKTIRESIEETNITGMKITGDDAVAAINDSRAAQGIYGIRDTDVALKNRVHRLVKTVETSENGVIGFIMSGSVTDDMDAAARSLSGETLSVGVSRALEDEYALKALQNSADLIENVTLAKQGLNAEGRFAENAIEVGKKFYTANKGKLALGALALAGTVIGYKMASRANENDLYDATMNLAPAEQGKRPYGIQEALMGNGQTSRRKDPLFTAGVVGNLDRQKIGHTSMGPSKHSHLFGDS